MKKLLVAACLLTACSISQAAVIAEYNLGTNLAATSQDANVTANDITFGSGLSGYSGYSTTGGGCIYARCSGTGLTDLAGAITDVDYVSFTIDVAAGYAMDLTSMTLQQGYTRNSSHNGKSLTADLLTNASGFTAADSVSSITSYATINDGGSTIHYQTWTIDSGFSGAEFQGLTGSVEFRFYLTDNTNDTNIIHRFDDIVLNGSVSLSAPEDTDPPTPGTMTFATAPYAVGSTSVAMVATTAADPSGVEYYFDETSGNPGGTDSGWQDSAIYVDRGLTPETQYTYTVIARDKSVNQNTTAASNGASATTDATGSSPGPLEEFSIIVLPDTQYYSNHYPQHFTAQTQWIKDNVSALNIKYVLHLGDIVDQNRVMDPGYSEDPKQTRQWDNAKASLSLLEGQVPYALATGNHDYGLSHVASDRETYFLNSSTDTTPYFGTGTPYAIQPSIGGFYIEPDATVKTDNSWHTFSVGGEDFIVIALEFGPRDEVVDWAETVVASHLNHHAILITHAYMYSDGTRYDWATKGTSQGGNPHDYTLASLPGGVNDGEELWQKLVKKYDNFIMTLSGHITNVDSGVLTSTGDYGNTVHEMLCDYQGYPEGGQGYLRIYTFKSDRETVEVKTYSPVLSQYHPEAHQAFNLQLSPPLSGTAQRPPLFRVFDGLGAPAFLSDGTLTMEQAGWTPSAPGTWWETDLWDETDVFLTQLDYDDSAGLDWRIKIGQGGQLYSILLPGVGEIMPPQQRDGSPWNDDVCTATLYSAANHNGDPEMRGYGNGFIHQAGMYISPSLDALNDKPLNSPLLAEAFDVANRTYSVINWGLVPTPSVTRADALFYTDYRHLGDGVLEITYYMYNFGTYDIPQPTTPWTGLRGPDEVYGTQILGKTGGGFDVFPYDHETRRYYLEDTGGWIGHTEDPNDVNSPAYSLVQGIDKHRGQPGYEGQSQRMNGYNLDTGGWRVMATDMWCNIQPGEGIFFRTYMTMGTLGDVAAKSEQLVDDVDYGWLEFDEATAEFLPLYEKTVSGQRILTTEVNGFPVAYSYAVPVKNSLPLIQMKEISSGTYVLSTDPYAVCSKMSFENQYDPADPKYPTYQGRVVYRPYDDNTEWVGLLGYVVPTAQATQPANCQPLSEILGEQIRFAPGEKQDSDELLIWTGQSPPPPSNDPPVFTSGKIVKPQAFDNIVYNGTISGSASDPEGDPLTYSKLLGPAWLNIAADGSLSGTPSVYDAGLNTWSVQVSDGNGQPDTATLNITVSYDNTSAIVQWGQLDGQSDIVGVRIDGDAGSFDDVYNPAVPASPSDPDYYPAPASDNRTPRFYAAGQRANWQMEIAGDIIGAYHIIPPATTNQSMVVWQSADFMLTGVDVDEFHIQLYNRYSTDRGDLYWLVEKSGSWYISEMVGEFNSVAPASISTADASSLTWYNFTPFGLDGNAPGVATIGSQATITMDNIDSVGYFFETENTHATDDKWVGSKVLYFAVTSIDVTPPVTAPTGLTATAGDAEVVLDWEDVAEAASYKVYRSTTSGSYGPAIETGVVASASTDSTADYDTLYYYAVTAVNSSGAESDKSNEAAMILYRGDLTLDGKVDLKDVAELGSGWQTGYFMDTLLDIAQDWLKGVPAPDMVGHWPLDETAGTVAPDTSIYGYDGTLMNMDNSDWVAGKTGNALDFDGVNDYVAIENLPLVLAGGDVTVSAWMKASTTNIEPQFMISMNTSNGDDNKILLGTQANSDTLSLYESEWHDTATTVIDNTWHHIAYVLEDSSNTITIYVNGSEVLSFASTASIAASDVFSLGQEYDAGMAASNFYNGLLDDVRIYDRALSEQEIQSVAYSSIE